jgi:perosamine synthetase
MAHVPVIPHNRPTLGSAEREAVTRVIDSGWVAQGKEVEAFESEICEYLGVARGGAVAVSSGSAALFLSLWALGAKGRRVAIPVYSCAAVRNAVMMAGGEPVPVDVASGSPNIDLTASADRADLIVAAHVFGIPCALPSVGLPVVEDCAQAFGARCGGQPVGLNGTVGIFSFYATKLLTSGGQGGMVVSRNADLIAAMRDYREFDCRRDRVPRFNLQMTDLQAAVGRAQLAQVGAFLARRSEIYEHYLASGLPLWSAGAPIDASPCRYRAILRLRDPEVAIAQLAAQGVRAIVPIADWELLGEAEQFPLAAALARSTVSLPIFPTLTGDELARVIAAVRRVG